MSVPIRVFAPASISNLGPGFDVLGLALDRPGDIVEIEPSDRPGIEIVEVTGDGGILSRDAARNVAGVAAAEALAAIEATTAGAGSDPRPRGARLRLHKRMPLASGLGSSGASSVAGAFAVNELLGRPLTPRQLLPAAMKGEQVASGSMHADNVAPSLLGGLVLIRSYEPLDVIDLPVPPRLHVVVVHPHCEVSTAAARTLVAGRTFSLGQAVVNLGNMGAFVSALHRGDLDLLGRAIHDELVEPARAHLIPGFHQVKAAALDAGALGCSIAGSGPSVFAFCGDPTIAEGVGLVMREAFWSAGKLDSEAFIGLAGAPGARQVEPGWDL